MQSDTMTIQALFQDRRQYRVPFFQRPYVWNRGDQWERLWDDVAEKAEARLDGGDPPPHFLGAVVLEPHTKKGLLGVETLDIIDGQQRLTTLQYLISALAIVLRNENATQLLAIVETCMRNGNADTMLEPDVEVFKVWPTFRDRANYRLAMGATTLDELRERFPASFTQVGELRKIGIGHPPALEAIWYFADQIERWIAQDGDGGKKDRVAAVTEAVLTRLRLVWIALGEQDDAQVIFETLNGHGAELHATDLIRNFVFMRADGDGAAGQELFINHWTEFEGEFWTQEQRRGRLSKPRTEWFFQTALQATLGDEVEIGRLYANYRRYALGAGKPIPAAEQLRMLGAHASNYRQLISGTGDTPVARFGRRTAAWDASTAHPLALRIAASGVPTEEQMVMLDDLTSYFVRRAVCGLTPKNYNKVLLQMLKRLAAGQLTATSLRASLAGHGDASRWPRDEEFRKAWLSDRIYPGRLDAARTKSLLSEIETAIRTAQSEDPVPGGLENLDIDHILPTSWFEHWPLPDGTYAEPSEANSLILLLLSGEAMSARQVVISRREDAKATLGNLTLVHYGVNRAVQNREFQVKREKLLQESNLHLNRSLMLLDGWDEARILERAQKLFEIAVRLWRGPEV